MKRVAQGVPVQTLDLRMCTPQSGSCTEKWLRSLSEIVVDVLVSENIEAREQMMSNCKLWLVGPFKLLTLSRTIPEKNTVQIQTVMGLMGEAEDGKE